MRLVSFLRSFVGLVPRDSAVGLRRGSARRAPIAAMVAAGLIAPMPAAAETPVAAAEEGTEFQGLVRALARAETPEAATAIRRRLIRLRMRSQSATAGLLVSRAAAARLAGDDGLALDLLDAAIVAAPEWAGARHFRGMIHLSRGAEAAATADLAAAARLDPSDATTLALLARLRETAGDKAAALALLRRAAAADPQFPGLAEATEALSLEVEGQPL